MIQRFEAFTSAISGIHRQIQRIERSEMARYGLKGSYTQYLLSIAHRPEGITAARLCKLCDRNKAAVSRILAEMESAGLICRSAKPYKSLLSLTPKGSEAVHYIQERCQLATSLAGQGLSEEDRSTLYRALHHIETNLQKLSELGLPNSTTSIL